MKDSRPHVYLEVRPRSGIFRYRGIADPESLSGYIRIQKGAGLDVRVLKRKVKGGTGTVATLDQLGG